MFFAAMRTGYDGRFAGHLKDAAKGQFKRHVLFEQGSFRGIVGADETDIDGVFVGSDFGYAREFFIDADPQHLRDASALHLLESALLRSEVKGLAIFAQQT